MVRARNWKMIGLVVCLCLSINITTVFAQSYGISSSNIKGKNTTYITLDMNAGNLSPLTFTAGNSLTQAQGLSQMARENSCIAAINGTYFEAYHGTPVPWGTIIKNGKVLHVGNMGSTVGITSSGKLMIDHLTIEFKGYINGEYRSIPWRINHPSTEAEAITIFTPEYGGPVTVAQGALAPIIEDGKVSRIASSNFTVPNNGFAIVYNASVSHLVTERFQVGDQVSYEAVFVTKHTKAEDWKEVQTAIGAGPSLIINGQVTANGAEEGFWEAKVNTGKGLRTFIGATKEGKILMGTIPNADLKEAAAVCQQLGLINAMCLDGGGSTSLYFNGKAVSQGRNVNNGLGFVLTEGKIPLNFVEQTNSALLVNGVLTNFEAYSIYGNNYIKLRDFAAAINGSDKNFEVGWDYSNKVITLISKAPYTAVGGELIRGSGGAKAFQPSNAILYRDGQPINMIGYTIENRNFFKLRDVAKAFNVGVAYDATTKTVSLNTSMDYTE